MGDPPPFVRLASHPVRWRLLQELVRSDRAVSELMTLVDEPQSLVSYHLRQLRDGGLVFARRSSADRRDSYYAIDLVACREALQAAGGALHPALQLAAGAPGPCAPRRARVAGGGCCSCAPATAHGPRSPRRCSSTCRRGRSRPSAPAAIRSRCTRTRSACCAKRGIDISANRTKHLDEFVSQRFDEVITLCDRVREVCPEFPSHPELVHWSIPDPALEGPTNRASYPAFVRTADELETRISFQLHLLADPATTRRSNDAER